MKKNTYRSRRHRRTPLSPRGAVSLGIFGTEAELIAHELRQLSDDFLNPAEPVTDWRELKSKHSPEAE